MSTLPSSPPFSFPRLRIPALSSPLSSASQNFFPSAASDEADSPSSDPAPILPLFLFGLLAALGTACLVCKVPAAFMHSWTSFFLRSIAFVIGVIAAGIAGMQILWLLLSEKPTLNFGSLSLSLACSWAFLPSIVFFYREHSPWMLAAIPLATAVTAISLRRLFISNTNLTTEPEFTPPPPTPTVAVPDFSGISTPNRNLWWIVAIAAAAQAAILLWLLNQTPVACVLLVIPSFVITWQGSAAARKPKHPIPYLQLLLALLFTALALLPWLDTPFAVQLSHILRSDRTPAPALLRLRPASAVDYMSIVLWPSTPKKKITVVQPLHHSLTPGTTEVTKPLVIPFDGPYWYFQPPDTHPSPNAFVMHGKSTDVNMHSTNDFPLQMEAHQTLAKPIQLDCCREIDVAITNADNRPGLIAMNLILTDTTSPTHPSQELTSQPIVSSESAHFSLVRPPVQETLRFHIPLGQLLRFNDITIIFNTSQERTLGGAKVAIKQFTLVPH